jgi:tight adherence protein C
MTGVALLMAAATLLGLAAGVEVLAARAGRAGERDRAAPDELRVSAMGLPAALAHLGLERRIIRSGLEQQLTVTALIAAKLACALTGLITGLAVAPAAPGRLALAVALAMPSAGFLAPDAWLEHRARARLRSLRVALPDALDLLSVGAAAGRSPLAGMAEIGEGKGPLARELAVLGAEASCGLPRRELLAGLRARAPVSEVASVCAVIERSQRYGSPLAEQLAEQATSMRAAQRTRIEEHAARAAPKIQLAVALLLVPSVLLMIAAGLLANIDRFLAGL